MINVFNQGGWVMYVLLCFSVSALAVIAERCAYYFLTRRAAKHSFLTRIKTAFDACKHDEQAFFEESMTAAAAKITQSAKRRLSILQIISHISPLTGLLGTVLGMVEMFKKLEESGGRADIAALAGGIWIALLTTVFGLIVAIPSTLAHHLFSRITARRAEEMRSFVSDLIIQYRKRNA